MISGIGYTPMQSLQGTQRTAPTPPQMPGPDAIPNRGIQKLEDNVKSGRIDPEELANRLAERFGDKAEGIVGEDGGVDFDALRSLLEQDRYDQLQAGLSERFGAEAAASVFNDDGRLDGEALANLMGVAPPPMGPPPGAMREIAGATDSDSDGDGDSLAEIDAELPPPGGPGGPGGLWRAEADGGDSTSLENMIKPFLTQRMEATGYGAQGQKHTGASAVDPLVDIFA